MKKALCLLLSCLMIGSLACCAGPRSAQMPQSTGEFSLYGIPTVFEDPFAPQPSELSFSEISDPVRTDIEPLKTALARMESLCAEKNALADLQELYRFCYNEVVDIKTEASVASIRYDMDTQSPERMETSLRAAALQAEAVTLYESTMKKVLASSYAKQMIRFIGPDVAALFETPEVDPVRLAELLTREDACIKEYNRLRSGSLPEEERKLRMAELYIGLVEVRREIAAIYGYENAAEYYYKEAYSREYSPEEAAAFHANVKEYIVPAVQRINRIFTGRTDAVMRAEQTLSVLETYLPQISPEMAELYAQLTERDMIFVTDDCNASRGAGYTMKLYRQAGALVYNGSPHRSYRTLTDTVHEFGHYCDIRLNGIFSAQAPVWKYDLAEVCSSGLEVLFYDYYDEIFSGETGDEKAALLKGFLELIVSGCLYDEAQQRVFAYEGELTPDVVNAIFLFTAAEYGFISVSGDYFWTANLHNYRYPFYYLSYAAAYAASSELWMMARTEGRQAAVDTYLQLLSMGSFEYSYSQVMEACGMQGFASEEMLSRLARTVEEEVALLLGKN